jgi:hypothetical protein
MSKTPMPTFHYSGLSFELVNNGDLLVTAELTVTTIPRTEVFNLLTAIVSEMTLDQESNIPLEVQQIEKEKTVSSLRRHLITLNPVVKSIELE